MLSSVSMIHMKLSDLYQNKYSFQGDHKVVPFYKSKFRQCFCVCVCSHPYFHTKKLACHWCRANHMIHFSGYSSGNWSELNESENFFLVLKADTISYLWPHLNFKMRIKTSTLCVHNPVIHINWLKQVLSVSRLLSYTYMDKKVYFTFCI